GVHLGVRLCQAVDELLELRLDLLCAGHCPTTSVPFVECRGPHAARPPARGPDAPCAGWASGPSISNGFGAMTRRVSGPSGAGPRRGPGILRTRRIERSLTGERGRHGARRTQVHRGGAEAHRGGPREPEALRGEGDGPERGRTGAGVRRAGTLGHGGPA